AEAGELRDLERDFVIAPGVWIRKGLELLRWLRGHRSGGRGLGNRSGSGGGAGNAISRRSWRELRSQPVLHLDPGVLRLLGLVIGSRGVHEAVAEARIRDNLRVLTRLLQRRLEQLHIL